MNRQPRIGQRLAAARLRRSLSQSSVAREAGIAPSYLSRIETGKVQPTFRTISRIAHAMEMGFDELAEFDPEGHRHGALCPITDGGHCLLDLIRADSEHARERHHEFYTVQQITLVRRFAAWLRSASHARQQACETLLEDLLHAQAARRDRR